MIIAAGQGATAGQAINRDSVRERVSRKNAYLALFRVNRFISGRNVSKEL